MEKSLKFLIYKKSEIKLHSSRFNILLLTSFLLTIAILFLIIKFQMAYFLILLIPAYFANMFAYWSSKIVFLKPLGKPVDLNLKWFDGSRLLGNSKTFRGVFSGISLAIIVAFIFYLLSPYFAQKTYQSIEETLLFGFLVGFGAMIGDLIRSFLKRRLGMTSGKNWFLFDDLDFVVGALFFMSIYIKFPMNFVILTLIGTIPLRVFTHIIDFKLKAKKFY